MRVQTLLFEVLSFFWPEMAARLLAEERSGCFEFIGDALMRPLPMP